MDPASSRSGKEQIAWFSTSIRYGEFVWVSVDYLLLPASNKRDHQNGSQIGARLITPSAQVVGQGRFYKKLTLLFDDLNASHNLGAQSRTVNPLTRNTCDRRMIRNAQFATLDLGDEHFDCTCCQERWLQIEPGTGTILEHGVQADKSVGLRYPSPAFSHPINRLGSVADHHIWPKALEPANERISRGNIHSQ